MLTREVERRSGPPLLYIHRVVDQREHHKWKTPQCRHIGQWPKWEINVHMQHYLRHSATYQVFLCLWRACIDWGFSVLSLKANFTETQRCNWKPIISGDLRSHWTTSDPADDLMDLHGLYKYIITADSWWQRPLKFSQQKYQLHRWTNTVPS